MKKKTAKNKKKIDKKYENFDEKKTFMSDASIVEASNIEKKRSQIKIMIFDKISSSAKAFDVTIVDFFLSSKIRKFRIFSKFKLVDFWKSAENSDDLIQKIRNIQITLNLKKLMIYVFAAHKLFTKRLFEKQTLKLQIRSLKINMNVENVNFWYLCANFRVWASLKNRVRILTLMNSETEINFMNADVQKNLRFTMHAMSINFRISFQIDQILNLIDVCFYVKIKIKKLSIYHHFFVVNRFDHFFIFEQFFLTAMSINYDYRADDIYAIYTNSEMTRFAMIKIMNRFDRLNKNRIKMYDFFAFLKKMTTI